MKERNWRAGLAWAFLALGLLAGVAFLGRLSTPLPELMEISLFYEEGDSKGWQFATEAGPIQPELGMGATSRAFPPTPPAPSPPGGSWRTWGAGPCSSSPMPARGSKCSWTRPCCTPTFPTRTTGPGPFCPA